MRAALASLRRVHASLIAALLGTVGLVSANARASGAAVAVGEVHGSTPSGEYSAPFRSLLTAEIARIPVTRSRERFVLSATLVSLDAEKLGDGARASAVVSLVLRSAEQQTLHAELRGRATAETTGASVSETRDDALRAAVTSALKRLPEALR